MTPDHLKVEVIRLDTGEIVETRETTAAERQTSLRIL
jgi:hypothetical protein